MSTFEPLSWGKTGLMVLLALVSLASMVGIVVHGQDRQKVTRRVL